MFHCLLESRVSKEMSVVLFQSHVAHTSASLLLLGQLLTKELETIEQGLFFKGTD